MFISMCSLIALITAVISNARPELLFLDFLGLVPYANYADRHFAESSRSSARCFCRQ
jgi:hypothetical protein